MNDIIKKKILIIAPRFPIPAVGGDRVRLLQIIEYLSDTIDVHLIALVETPPTDEAIKQIRMLVTTVSWIKHPKWKSFLNCLWGLLHGISLQESYYRSDKLREEIKKHSDFDIALFYSIRMAQYGKDFPGFKILDMCDLVSANYENAKSLTTSHFWRILYMIESTLLVKSELIALKIFDQIMFINLAETKNLPLAEKISWLPNSVSPDYLNSTVPIKSSFDLCFIGKMDYQPNITAIIWFIYNVLPHIDMQFSLKIIGPGLPRWVVDKISLNSRIVYLGFVEDPASIMCNCAAMIAPMQTGGGVQNKILEGMALGLPVITTPLAVSGIPGAIHNENILIANTQDQWIFQIEELKMFPQRAHSIGIKAKELIRDNFEKKIVKQHLLKMIQRNSKEAN